MSGEGLLVLAERCEKAGPDETRDLLLEAFYAINGEPMAAHIMEADAQHSWIVKESAFIDLLRGKGFLDAAMTLVPEGVATFKFTHVSKLVNNVDNPAEFWVVVIVEPGVGAHSGNGVSNALALCAAALRARAATDGSASTPEGERP